MNKQKFFDTADRVGVEVEYRAGRVSRKTGEVLPYEIVLFAPKGKVFAGDGTHADWSIRGEPGTVGTDWRLACAVLEALLAEGLLDCDDPDCDICSNDD